MELKIDGMPIEVQGTFNDLVQEFLDEEERRRRLVPVHLIYGQSARRRFISDTK